MNLGGFANISYEKNGVRFAFDICPVNMILNALAQESGKEYDEDGNMAMQGSIDEDLLNKLNDLEYYKQSSPKSLGREWYENSFMPLVQNSKINLNDKLRTVCEHIAIQISKAAFNHPGATMLATGGGAFNNFLIELIQESLSMQGIHVVIPEAQIVSFKEAMTFAFLGLLRSKNKINVLSSVTGASKDSVSGGIFIAPK